MKASIIKYGIIAALGLAAAYLAVQIFTVLDRPYRTETAILHDMSDSLSCGGYLVFEQSEVPGEGQMGYLVSNGERVATGTQVAEIYSDPSQARARTALTELDAQLELLERSFPDVPEWRFRRELAPLAVTEDVLYRSFSTLSGGEQAKLLLALLFAREGRYLLIDEPTNHLDETGRALVSRYLAKKSGFLLVSHDRAFLDGCVDHILSLDRDRIQVRKGDFSGWYQDYLTRVQSEREHNERLKKEIDILRQNIGREP